MIINQSQNGHSLGKGGGESKTSDECEEHCPDIAQRIRCMLNSQGKVISANCLLIYL